MKNEYWVCMKTGGEFYPIAKVREIKEFYDGKHCRVDRNKIFL